MTKEFKIAHTEFKLQGTKFNTTFHDFTWVLLSLFYPVLVLVVLWALLALFELLRHLDKMYAAICPLPSPAALTLPLTPPCSFDPAPYPALQLCPCPTGSRAGSRAGSAAGSRRVLAF